MRSDESKTRTEAIGDQLRAKISSKFQASTFLGGFAFTVLTIQLSISWQSKIVPFFLPACISLMVVSLGLYGAAVVKLDGLTLPKRFWTEDPNHHCRSAAQLAYLKDEDLWQLKDRMVFYWQFLTLAATALMAISLSLMLLPVSPRQFSEGLVEDTFLWVVILLISMGVYFVVLYLVVRHRKRKGCWNPLLRPHD